MARSHWGASHLVGPNDPDATPIPDLDHVRGVLMRYLPADAEQARTRVEMISFLMDHTDALERSCLEGHFTASGLVIRAEGEAGLLTHHRKLNRWLQVGGHCDGDGNLAAVALREATEESGIQDLEVDPRPVDLDIHRIPARPGEPEHWHLDVRFLIYAPPQAKLVRNEESLELAWVAPEELQGIDTDESVRRLFRLAFGG